MMKEFYTSLAGARAGLYSWIAAVLGRLPDEGLVDALLGPSTQPMLAALEKMRTAEGKNAAKALRNSIRELEEAGEDKKDVLERWAIDRTRLLRQTPGKHLPPPYESLYTKKKADAPANLVVQRFYRRVDICPQGGDESPDFLPMEVDFMAALCREEARSDSDAAHSLRLEQKAFLESHVGAWAHEYCSAALPEARTDLFRAVLLLLPQVLSMDGQLLEEMTAA